MIYAPHHRFLTLFPAVPFPDLSLQLLRKGEPLSLPPSTPPAPHQIAGQESAKDHKCLGETPPVALVPRSLRKLDRFAVLGLKAGEAGFCSQVVMGQKGRELWSQQKARSREGRP